MPRRIILDNGPDRSWLLESTSQAARIVNPDGKQPNSFSSCLISPRNGHSELEFGSLRQHEPERKPLALLRGLYSRRSFRRRPAFFWWAHQDLNLEPKHYECSALTN
jgi:hypothetical protein